MIKRYNNILFKHFTNCQDIEKWLKSRCYIDKISKMNNKTRNLILKNCLTYSAGTGTGNMVKLRKI